MKRTSLPWVLVVFVALSMFSLCALAQQTSPGFAVVSGGQTAPANVIAFSDTVAGQADGAVTATFALYPDAQSTTPAWTETQVVQVTQGRYSVLLGSATADGIPPAAFAADQAHWLGVQVNGTEKRYLLVSVPFAMKAMEAERLGGLLPSQFVTTAQLQAALQNAASSSAPSTGGTKPASGPVGQASLNPPEPATDFTDNNTSEVLLVTQQGTGFAIHAISAGDAALFGENTTPTGTAVKALASGTSGANIGLLAQSASPTGIAGVFDNTGNGQILSLRNNGNEVASVDNAGDFKGNQVQANVFVGSGAGLVNIPNSATTATPTSAPNTIVLRDNAGGITANQVVANFLSGDGSGLFNIPNSATTATTASSPNTIVLRDNAGGITGNQIFANNYFAGSGSGLFNIPNSATTATPSATANTIVQRDNSGGFLANSVIANFFSGNGGGLFNIPNSATSATSANTPSTIVARDSSGGFVANNIQAFGLSVGAGGLFSTGVIDFTSGTTTPVHAVLSANTPTSCAASKELLIKTDAVPGQQLFICNAAGNGYVLVGDGTAAGVTSVGAGDGSVAIGGTAAAPTVAVANGGITSAKLAPNAITSANIANGSITNSQLAANAVTAVNVADGSLPPSKIAGTAATLGNNTFIGNQVMPGLFVNGTLNLQGLGNGFINLTNTTNTAFQVNAGSATAPGIVASAPFDAMHVQSTNGIGILSNGGEAGFYGEGTVFGIEAQSGTGTALSALTTDGGIPGVFTSVSPTAGSRIISGRIGSGASEVFSVDGSGNLFNLGNTMFNGAISTLYPNGSAGTVTNGLVKLTSNGFAVATSPSDTGGAIGIAISGAGTTGNVQIAYGGRAICQFDSTPTVGDYVGMSRTTAGNCVDLGSFIPFTGGVQIIGHVISPPAGTVMCLRCGEVLLGTEDHGGSLSVINTGPGLIGGPITSSGTISIANAGVTNAMLQNNVVSVNAGLGLSGGGLVPLGGQVTLSNAGALSFNGRTGSIISQPGDYSFGMIAGTLSSNQLPPSIVYGNQSNTFTADQTINGALTTNSLTTNSLTTSSLTVNVPNGTSTSIKGSASGGFPVLSVADTGPANPGNVALFASSSNNLAANFFSAGPDILSAGTLTHQVFDVNSNGVLVFGNVTAQAFSGDGSALTNVNASSIGGTTLGNLATTSALNAETAARQSGDTTLQNNINSESSARQSADAALATSISAETAARQADTSNLQTNINNLSAADAKLASPNTFTASNTFTGGTQDFSGAGATLPVRSLPSAQTPATCVPSKELLIKTDAPAGQQLFLCDAGGTTWNLVGDGASGGVTSFNGRNGPVSPASGDYSFTQIAGSLATAQLPALTGDVIETAGTGITALTATGVTAGTYSKVTVDAKGRVASGSQASFSDLGGVAAQSQLPASVVYNNQANTFSAGQTVNGTLTATAFTGNGAGLSNVNAASLNGLAPASFAQLGASGNNFAGSVTASSFSGNGSALTNVNAATVNNLQMLKLTASITPASVSIQSCSEQSFTVTGVNSGDVLLSVQLASHSPGTNIAIGGWRVPAANTVAIQFCNVSRSSSTPAAGTYTFALMR